MKEILYSKVKLLGTVKTKKGLENKWLIKFKNLVTGKSGEEIYTDTLLAQVIKSWEQDGNKVREVEKIDNIKYWIISQKLLKDDFKNNLLNKNSGDTISVYTGNWTLDNILNVEDITEEKIFENEKISKKVGKYDLIRLKEIKKGDKIIVLNSKKEIFCLGEVSKEIYKTKYNENNYIFNGNPDKKDQVFFAIDINIELNKEGGYILLDEKQKITHFKKTIDELKKEDFLNYEKIIKLAIDKLNGEKKYQLYHKDKIDEIIKKYNGLSSLARKDYSVIKGKTNIIQFYEKSILFVFGKEQKKIINDLLIKLDKVKVKYNKLNKSYIKNEESIRFIELDLKYYEKLKDIIEWVIVDIYGYDAKKIGNQSKIVIPRKLYNDIGAGFTEVLAKTLINNVGGILNKSNKIDNLSKLQKYIKTEDNIYNEINDEDGLIELNFINFAKKKVRPQFTNVSRSYRAIIQGLYHTLNSYFYGDSKSIKYFQKIILDNEDFFTNILNQAKDIYRGMLLNEINKEEIENSNKKIENTIQIIKLKDIEKYKESKNITQDLEILYLKSENILDNINPEKDLETILKNTRENNKYSFDDLDTLNIMTSLKVKPFVILTGISGVGKSLRVKQIAKAIYGENYTKFYKHIAVKPNWTDNTALFGYYNPLTKEYVNGELNEFINKAFLNPDKPFFVLLDEINLARVEYYMSDILSHMEDFDDEGFTRFIPLYEIDEKDLINHTESSKLGTLKSNSDNLTSDELTLKKELECKKNRLDSIKNNNYIIRQKDNGKKEVGYILSKNVFFVGTANIDETTHGFSNKVLDRCSVIEIENDYGMEVKNDYEIEGEFDLIINFRDYNIKLNSFLYQKIIDITNIDEDEEEIIIKILNYLKDTEYKNKIEKYIIELLNNEDEEYIKKGLILSNIIKNEEIIFKIISLNKKIKKLNIKSEIFSLLSKEQNEEHNLVEYIKNILLKNEVKTEEENYFLVSTLGLFPQFKDDLLDYIYTNDDDVKIKVIKILKDYNNEIYFRELFDNIDNSNNIDLKLLSINALIRTDKEKDLIEKLKELIFSRKGKIDISVLKKDLIELSDYLKNNLNFVDDLLHNMQDLDFSEQADIINFILELIGDNHRVQEYLIDIFERKDEFEEEQLIPLSYYLKDVENEEIINKLINYLDDNYSIYSGLRGLRGTKNLQAINKIYAIYKDNKNDDRILNLCRLILLGSKYNSEIINDIKNNIDNIDDYGIELFLNVNNKMLNTYILREIIKGKNINLEKIELLIGNIVNVKNIQLNGLNEINNNLALYSHRVVGDIQKYINSISELNMNISSIKRKVSLPKYNNSYFEKKFIFNNDKIDDLDDIFSAIEDVIVVYNTIYADYGINNYNKNETDNLKNIIRKFIINSSSEKPTQQTKDYETNYKGFITKTSFGMGNLADITWLSLLKDGNETSNGIYPCLLFDRKNKELIVAYGVSDANTPKINWEEGNILALIGLDYSLKQKIFPKIKGDYEDLEDELEKIQEIILPYEKSSRKLKKMIDNGDKTGYITFWK